MREAFFVLVLLVFFGCGSNGTPIVPPAIAPSSECPLVRVLLGEGENVTISAEVEFCAESDGKAEKFKAGEVVSARVVGEDVYVGGISGRRVVIKAAFDGTIEVFNRHWRGQLLLLPRKGVVRVVNIVPMESYLAGVVGMEMGKGFMPEALAAQAIVARTYALWMIQHPKDKDFHLTRTPATQAYGGVEAESEPVRLAVRVTSGLVLTFKKKVFPAFYHAICGGRTSSAAFVFGNPVYGVTEKGLGPLDGGVECTYCETTSPPHRFSFRLHLTKKEVVSLLKNEGYSVEKVSEMVPVESDSAGRHKAVLFRTDKGEIRVSVAKLRRLLRYRLHSALFSIKKENDSFLLEGHGWGHGVGMCQWGAEGMARLGFSCAEILEFYYRNTEIKRFW